MSALLITLALSFSGPVGFPTPAIPNELKPIVMGILAVALVVFAIGKRRE
jgi:hypothetical protein